MTPTALPAYAPTKEPVRMVRGTLSFAERTEPKFTKVRTSKLAVAQANGIRYENKVHKALSILAKTLGATVERNPWFKFVDENGTGYCSPDSILWIGHELALVVEVKYTWVPTAQHKLKGLYVPVINAALSPGIIRSLIVCKNLVPGAPQPIENLSAGTILSVHAAPTYQWLGQRSIIW